MASSVKKRTSYRAIILTACDDDHKTSVEAISTKDEGYMYPVLEAYLTVLSFCKESPFTPVYKSVTTTELMWNAHHT